MNSVEAQADKKVGRVSMACWSYLCISKKSRKKRKVCYVLAKDLRIHYQEVCQREKGEGRGV